MSTTLNLPFWHCSSPPNVPDCSEELDIIIQRLAAGDTDLDVDSQAQSQIPLDNGMPASGLPPICDSESADPSKFNDIYHLNNNVSDTSDYKCEEKNGKCNSEFLCGKDSVKCGWDESQDDEDDEEIPNIDKRDTYKDKIENHTEMCQTGRSSVENKVCGISGTVGGDGEESDPERSPRQQHEPDPSTDEINTSDVILSRDLTLNPLESYSGASEKKEIVSRRDRRNSCSTASSTCSAGSYSRRKHHKHHKHKQRVKSPQSEDSQPVAPKVNPIFLWVRQEDTRIVEVMCEDYDHRNRIRLTKTSLGWRAIPKTEIFAKAVIPKSQTDSEPEKSRKKITKRRKSKKKRSSKTLEKKRKSRLLDNPNVIKECSVALSRENVEFYQNKLSRDDSVESSRSVRSRSNSNSRDVLSRHSSRPSSRQNVNNSRSVSQESMEELSLCKDTVQRLGNFPKSNSCEFSSAKISQSLVKSKSLDFSIKSENVSVLESDPTVQENEDVAENITLVKSEPENTKEDIREPDPDKEDDSQRNQIVDMTKHDSDFADCDELGQLLKDIPDLEFVEEEELEEVEEEDWPTPTDLTVPKSKEEEESKPPRVKLPILPPSISSLVTVTSSTRPPEPLTAPLPEVTITPIPNPNPKPAHQAKPQNKFLETLLSTPHAIKPERDEVTITRTSDKRPLECFSKRDSNAESKAKKLKAENITLKSLLAKQQCDKSIKGLDIESCVKKMKNKQEDCTNSRLHELLTDGMNPVNVDPIAQLKQVLSNPDLAVPDPLLVPRARLPALVASPASEIPRLLTMHLDKKVEETPCPPLADPDMLEVSLSNLRSLLSYSPDKMKGADAEDLAAYQKSLEAFLEWQRYQTELMEAQIKNSSQLPPGEIDVATANALNQMLWLPYLNQLDMNCNGNRDFMSFMNSMMSHNYSPAGNNLSAPPHISTNHFAQSSPFLTPTSPMDIESQMKTLAMWQEAVMSQNQSRNKLQNTPLSPTEPRLKIPNVPSKKQGPMLSPLPSPQKGRGNNNCSQFSPNGNQKNHFNYDNYHHQMQMQHHQQQQNLIRHQHQQQMAEYRKQQKRQCEMQMQMRQAVHQRQVEMQMQQQQQRQEQQMIQFQQMQQNYSDFHQEISRQIKSEADRSDRKSKEVKQGTISVKPLSNLLEKNPNPKKSSSWQQFEEELKKSAELTNQMALRWKQFEEEMRKSQIQITKNQNKNKIKTETDWPPNVKTVQPEKSSEPTNNTLTTPKLKVKNLVDPNMSPPKLLKQIDPEHLPVVVDEPGPVPDESQAHLWHPLFGSKPNQTYNSPWRWTTVTVNGE